MAKWNFDAAHTDIGFWVRHMVVTKVRGSFTKWTGELDYDEANPTRSKVSITIDTASVDTHDEKRNGHLRSADFFDSEKIPHMTFKSTRVESSGGNKFKVHGDLSIHGVTKPVVLDAEVLGKAKDPWGNMRVSFEATTVINRLDFGLKWNQPLETGGVLVGDKVTIEVEAQATPA